jgi:hypothetical protein
MSTEFRIDEAIEILQRTPAVLQAMLAGQPAAWLDCRDDAKSFSALDVLGHLIYGEMTDWIPRARMILECGTSRAFDPFDRCGFAQAVEGKSVGQLLGEFAKLRQQSLEAVRSLELEHKLDLKGMHPELGEVSMRQLLATWAVHDLGHIAQISRTMARRYREDVGPWRAYISSLQP